MPNPGGKSRTETITERDLTLELASLRDRYAIEREIGHGGMGRVFAARDLKLGREVAIKVLPAGGHDEETLRRFEQEGRAAGSLNHPNVLTLHDIGACEAGPYIVSELLEGATLRERLHGKSLPPPTAVDYAVQLAQGLHAAHAKGVIHRDLKPDNLFITHDGKLKILDFGIAKLVERTDARDQTTEHGAVLGTVAYMSPEQVRGVAVDHRSDIFAFGSILYEMLSGARAFAGKSDIEIGSAILNDEPAPLPTRVAGHLDRILRRCLEKNPDDRFQSAADLTVELTRHAVLGPRSRVSRIALVALVITLGGAVYLKMRVPASATVERDSIAVLPFANLSGDSSNEYLSDGITEELINALANVEGLKVASRTSTFALKGKNQSVAQIGGALKVHAVLEGSVRRDRSKLRVVAQLIDAGNGFHLWSKTYDRELRDVLSVEDELARSIVEALRPTLRTQAQPLMRGTTASAEAHDAYLRALYFWNDRTQSGLRKAIALYQRAIDLDPGYALAHTGLADTYLLLAEYAPMSGPAGMMPDAKRHALRAVELDDELAEAHTSLAFIAHWDFDWTTAQREYRRAIELKPAYARAHHWYSVWFRHRGRFSESEAEIEQAHRLDPASMPINIVAAGAPYFRRDHEEAIDRLTKLLELAPESQQIRILLASAYVQAGRYPDAIAIVDQTLMPADTTSAWLSMRGYVHARTGDRAETVRALTELERRAAHEYVAPAFLALLHVALADNERALALLEEGYAVRDALLTELKVEPWWDPLRTDPRFRRLLQRASLE